MILSEKVEVHVRTTCTTSFSLVALWLASSVDSEIIVWPDDLAVLSVSE